MKFNPLTDLTPSQRDTAVKQLGGATENELLAISRSLRNTTSLTSSIASSLRRDNLDLQSDLSTISKLDERLKRIVPIIPEKFGEAGNIFPDKKPPDPMAGFKLPKFPKFPKFPLPGAPVLQPQPQPQPQPQREPKPEFEWPNIPVLPPIRLPDFEGIPGLAFRKGSDIIASADKKLTELGQNLDKFLKEKPGTAMAMDLGMGGFGTAARGIVAISPLLLRGLGPRAQVFLQRAFSGAPRYTPVAPITSTYGRQIGPQAAPLTLPKPPPITAAKVAPRTPVSLTAPYEELIKGLPTATGGRLGGQSVFARKPLLKGFKAGGLFRKGPAITEEELAFRQFLEDAGLSARAAKLSDPKYFPQTPGEIAARYDVLKELELADKTFARVTGPGSRIPKTAITKVDIRSFFDDVASGDLPVPNNTIAEIIGLKDPELRKRFLYYLRQAPKGQKQQNEGFLRKMAKGLELLPNGTQDDKDTAIKTIMRFLRPSGPEAKDSRRFLYNKLRQADKFADDVSFEEYLTKGEVEQLRIPEIEKMLQEMFEKNISGPQSSILGMPGSMDIASLGIDTSVEVQEIYYIVG